MESSPVFGQAPSLRFKEITVNTGLSHASINHMMQDEMGYLWIGTAFGLNRFDGNNFDKFLSDPQNPNSLKSSTIQQVYQDSKKNIWIGTQAKGLHRFAPEIQGFEHYPFLTDEGLPVDCRSILEDHQGKLLVGTNKRGLCLLDTTLNKLLPITHIPNFPKVLSSTRIYSLMEDKENRLWIGTRKSGIFIWSQDRKKWKHVPSFP